jgi:hypothetical protein
VHKLTDTGRCHANAEFECFDFFWYSDFHEFSPVPHVWSPEYRANCAICLLFE